MPLKKSFNLLVKIAVSLLLMVLVIQFLGPVTFSTDAFEFEAALKFLGSGRTFIHLPPLGQVMIPTHLPPLDFHLTLKGINPEEIATLAGNLADAGFQPAPIIEEIKMSLLKYLVSLLLLSFFLGIAAILLWGRQRINKKEMLWAGLSNLLVLLILLTVTIFSYNMEAFSSAEYEGMLEAAPWVLNALQGGAGVVKTLGGQFTEIVENISSLQKEMDQNSALVEAKDCKKVLHISDIHNNPAAFDFIKRIVDTFSVEIIIDTGDLVDLGTAAEMELFAQYFNDLKIPYIFIPGNHDSPSLVAKLKNMENITVLEAGTVEAAGLKIAGIADPASSSALAVVPDETAMEETARQLAKIFYTAKDVDIIAAHNPNCFKYLRGSNNILLGGHLHKPYIKKEDHYLEINAGTTGSSGIRGLKNMDINFSLVLLNLQYSETEAAYVPISADLIKVKQFPLNFSFERFLFND